jgi:hypothetical protein
LVREKKKKFYPQIQGVTLKLIYTSIYLNTYILRSILEYPNKARGV